MHVSLIILRKIRGSKLAKLFSEGDEEIGLDFVDIDEDGKIKFDVPLEVFRHIMHYIKWDRAILPDCEMMHTCVIDLIRKLELDRGLARPYSLTTKIA